MKKYETQAQNITVVASTPAGTISLQEVILQKEYKRCVGVRVVSVDTATLTQYNIGLQHNELINRNLLDYRDWDVPNGDNYMNKFKPMDISAGGTTMVVKTENPALVPAGQTLKYQIIFLLTNEEQ